MVEIPVALVVLAIGGAGALTMRSVTTATLDRIRMRALTLEAAQGAAHRLESATCRGTVGADGGWLSPRLWYRSVGVPLPFDGAGRVEAGWTGTPQSPQGGHLRWDVAIWCG